MALSACSAIDAHIYDRVAAAVRRGLAASPKSLPPWLFYDEAGSQLFDRITELPEYYLTRTERGIFLQSADAMVACAAAGGRLRIAELGAGSADKTRLLLAAAVRRQGAVVYEPLDVSESALEAARARIEHELPQVQVAPRVEDYTLRLDLDTLPAGERRLVLYIGSSIGNFEPAAALHLLQTVRAALRPGDALLLGVDLVKGEATLLAAYDDAAGVTAAFNRNLLVRLNRELGADFVPEAFAHCAVWNAAASRMEMHLESWAAQTVRLAALDLTVEFAPGERIHTENSYKYQPGQAETLLEQAGFRPDAPWTDAHGWFAVCLGRVE
ncbi:MAG: L-histidine N(alpha)-methyltransferase [Rhodoferax sp.]|nr:L-histidine N(alpha)-methyltransferase [Rhodoferax sp.]